MQVAEENVDLRRRALGKLVAEGGEPGPCVDDDEARSAADLDARRVSAELGKTLAGDGYGAPHAPEANFKGVLAGWRSPQHHESVAFPSLTSCAREHIMAGAV